MDRGGPLARQWTGGSGHGFDECLLEVFSVPIHAALIGCSEVDLFGRSPPRYGNGLQRGRGEVPL